MTVSDDELRPFFDAILAAPDSEAPRLAIAEFLTSRDDPRGEGVRMSCEIERLDADDHAARSELQKRCDTSPGFMFFTRIATNFPLMLFRRRGFVEGIECHPSHFIEHADLMMRNAPLRVY